jgi:hypothetical protein
MGPAHRLGRDPHQSNLVRGSFQTVEGSVAPSTEGSAAGRTSQRLDALGMPMLAIANQRMNVSIGDAAVQTLVVRTGEALGLYPLGCSSAAFHLTPGTRLPQEQVSQLRSRGGRSGNQVGCGA